MLLNKMEKERKHVSAVVCLSQNGYFLLTYTVTFFIQHEKKFLNSDVDNLVDEEL